MVKANPSAYSQSLKGKTLAMIFEKPSLRTRVTFDVGIEQLGGHPIYLSPAEISLGKRESVHDVAKNLERMVHGIMIRTFSHEIVEEMARCASVPVINGLTDFSHPCQAMADYLTMLEVKGRIAGLKVAYIGDGNNVAHSLMFAGAQLGANVWMATPPRYEPNLDATSWARLRCSETQGSVTSDPRSRIGGLPAPMWSTPTCGPAWVRRRSPKARRCFPSLPGERGAVRPGQEGRHLPALPARPSRRRGHRRSDRLATLVRLPAGGEPAARAKGDHAGTDGGTRR